MTKISIINREMTNTTATGVAQQNSVHQNPFGISFKGKILASDVFESTQPVTNSLKEAVTKKGKLYASAIIGSLSSAKGAISEKFTQVIEFVKTINGKVADMWSKFSQIEIIPGNLITGLKKTSSKDTTPKEVQELMQKPVTELSDMLSAKLAA